LGFVWTCMLYIKRKSEASFRKTEKQIDLFEAPQSQRWRDKEYQVKHHTFRWRRGHCASPSSLPHLTQDRMPLLPSTFGKTEHTHTHTYVEIFKKKKKKALELELETQSHRKRFWKTCFEWNVD
jgi:hypothetical protein